MKQDFKHRLLEATDIRRIHIVGCARSGTTMVHYAMLAFADTIVRRDAESRVWSYPSLGQALGLALAYGVPRRRRYLVTKRNGRWFWPDEVGEIIYSTRHHRMFLINVVRDPRDVLTSGKRGHEGLYVGPGRWQRSIEATEAMLDALRDCPNMLTIRYEDVVADPDRTAAVLMERVGLQLRPGITSWANLRENVTKLGLTISRRGAMHDLRSFDPASIGRWRHDPESRRFVEQMVVESPQRELLRRFMARHNYVDTGASA